MQIPFEELQDDAAAPPWDPAQVEAIRLAVVGIPLQPFEVCVAALRFE